jgi:hypothetical protein
MQAWEHPHLQVGVVADVTIPVDFYMHGARGLLLGQSIGLNTGRRTQMQAWGHPHSQVGLLQISA